MSDESGLDQEAAERLSDFLDQADELCAGNKGSMSSGTAYGFA
jgi:hypothetical protein